MIFFLKQMCCPSLTKFVIFTDIQVDDPSDKTLAWVDVYLSFFSLSFMNHYSNMIENIAKKARIFILFCVCWLVLTATPIRVTI